MVSHQQVHEATCSNPLLQEVLRYHNNAWPAKVKQESPLWSYSRRESLSVVRGCLKFGERVVIPEVLRKTVLCELHAGHSGITLMKRLARRYIYWPKIDDQIEKVVRGCSACAECNKDPARIQPHLWEPTSRPSDRVHADFAGPIDGFMYLVVVDSHSKWPEVFGMRCNYSSHHRETFGVVRTARQPSKSGHG